jgi:hypothetical protein
VAASRKPVKPTKKKQKRKGSDDDDDDDDDEDGMDEDDYEEDEGGDAEPEAPRELRLFQHQEEGVRRILRGWLEDKFGHFPLFFFFCSLV